MKIGYGKLGRTMSLTLHGCGNLGGDHEPLAVLIQLATAHPNDQFYVLGRNTQETAAEANLPANIINPWHEYGWNDVLRERGNYVRDHHANNANGTDLTIIGQIQMRDIFRDLTEKLFTEMDAHIWWVGQHGSTNTPVPRIGNPDALTKPYDWCAYYASFIFQGINAWRATHPDNEEVYLNSDPRNRHKMRDLKYPLKHPVLTQFNFTNRIKHEQYDGTPPTTSKVSNVYSRIEMNSLVPGTPSGDIVKFSDDFNRPGSFGLFINEARAKGIRPDLGRLKIMHDWVMPLDPYFVNGSWSAEANKELQTRWNIAPIEPVKPVDWASEYYQKLHSVRTTFTTPSSGSGWATTKPWEAFAAGTVCFFHPDYDTQDLILGDADPGLKKWLRVRTPHELRIRIEAVNARPSAFRWLITKQREHFDRAIEEKPYLRMIEKRIWTS